MNFSVNYFYEKNFFRVTNDLIFSMKGLMAEDDIMNDIFLAPQNINGCFYIPYHVDDTVIWKMFYQE